MSCEYWASHLYHISGHEYEGNDDSYNGRPCCESVLALMLVYAQIKLNLGFIMSEYAFIMGLVT